MVFEEEKLPPVLLMYLIAWESLLEEMKAIWAIPFESTSKSNE